MAVLKLFSQREDTYAQVMVAVRQAQRCNRRLKSVLASFASKLDSWSKLDQKDCND